MATHSCLENPVDRGAWWGEEQAQRKSDPSCRRSIRDTTRKMSSGQVNAWVWRSAGGPAGGLKASTT